MKNNIYSEILNDAIKSIGGVSDSVSVIGEPIVTKSGTTVIPISKITVGLISGTGEYGKVKVFSCNKNYPKSNAGGGVVSIKPFGFLVEKGKRITFLSAPTDYVDKAMDAALSILEDKNEK